MAIELNASKLAPDLAETLAGALDGNATKKNLAILERAADERHREISEVYSLAQVVETTLIEKLHTTPAIQQLTRANVNTIRADLGYDIAPMIERLLIENICACWLRLQWTEYQVATRIDTYEDGEYWEKRLSAAQRRYLRAVETLARVRKMALPPMQVNIASEGGQQVNIAGDLVKRR